MEKLALFVEVSIHFLEDKLIDDKAFAPGMPGRTVFIDSADNRFLIGDNDPGDVLDIQLVGDI